MRQPAVRSLVEESVQDEPRHLRSTYSFVQRFRPALAQETIRARVYEALAAGRLARVAPGVYFARSGPATLLLVQGDAREVLRRIDGESIDAIITDPPYDLGTQKHTTSGTTRPHRGRGRTYKQWDLDRATLAEMFRVLRKDLTWNTISARRRRERDWPRGGGALLLFAPPIVRSTWPHIRRLVDLAESLGFVFYGSITWDQAIKGMGYDCGRNQKAELLLFTAGPRNGLLWDLSLPNILRERRHQRRADEHEAEKPTRLFLRLIEALTRPGDVVADFFAGRGSWIPQALAAGRHVIAVEAQPTWVARIRSDVSRAPDGHG
jgi:site-specific DNA-methyltransferase (adenine-specific)